MILCAYSNHVVKCPGPPAILSVQVAAESTCALVIELPIAVRLPVATVLKLEVLSLRQLTAFRLE